MHQVKKLKLKYYVNNKVFNLRPKFRTSVILFISFAVGAFALFLHNPKPQADCGFVQNVYGQRISWNGKLPIEVEIDYSIPADLKPAIYRAAKTWEVIAGQPLFVFKQISKKNTGPNKDKKNGIYFLLNWDSNNRAEQGRTSVYWIGDEIQEADIRINGAQFAFYDRDPKNLVFLKNSDDTNLSGAKENSNLGRADFSSQSTQQPDLGYNFEALMLHELGHLLGLKHKELSPAISVMETYLAANTNRIELSDADKKNLTCEYK